MNNAQKKILIVGLILIIMSCLFPPWAFKYQGGIAPIGYMSIFAPQLNHALNTIGFSKDQEFFPGMGIFIDLRRLIIQWIVIICSMGAAWIYIHPTIYRKQ